MAEINTERSQKLEEMIKMYLSTTKESLQTDEKRSQQLREQKQLSPNAAITCLAGAEPSNIGSVCHETRVGDTQLNTTSLGTQLESIGHADMAAEKCAIEGCPNSLDTLPAKIFVPVPFFPMRLRNRWLSAMGYDVFNPPYCTLYCCEDHFDLSHDVRNVDSVAKIKFGIVNDLLKEGVVPHRFLNCRPIKTHDRSGTKESKQTQQVYPKIRIRTVEELRTSTCIKTFDNHVSVIEGPVSKSIVESKSSKSTSIEKSQPFSSAKDSKTTKYRECFVPQCPNNMNLFPNMHFICAPIQETSRRKWCNAIGRQMLIEESIYICSEHFKENELEMFRVPVSRNNTSGTVAYQKRARHGVVPSLKLGKATDKNSFRQDTRESAMQPECSTPCLRNMLQLSSTGPKITPVLEKFIARALPQLPNCQHHPKEEFACSRVSLVDYSTFYSKFYELKSRQEQEQFIYSRAAYLQSHNPSQNKRTFKFFIDSKEPDGGEVKICVCTQAFSSGLSLDSETLNSLLIRHFPPGGTPSSHLWDNGNDLQSELIVIDDDSPDETPASSTKKRRLPCPTCGATFVFQRTLENHVREWHVGYMSQRRTRSKPEGTGKLLINSTASNQDNSNNHEVSQKVNEEDDDSDDGAELSSLSSSIAAEKEDGSNETEGDNLSDRTVDSREDFGDLRVQSLRRKAGKRTTYNSSKKKGSKNQAQLTAPTRRSLRFRKNTNFTEIFTGSGSESPNEVVSESTVSASENGEDPDYYPSSSKKTRVNKRTGSSETSESEISEGESSIGSSHQSKEAFNNELTVAVRSSNNHYKSSERCGKVSTGTVFECRGCSKTFVSQTALDIHRAQNPNCSNLVIVELKSREGDKVATTSSKEQSNHLVCHKCDSQFSTEVGLNQHLLRSTVCRDKKSTWKKESYIHHCHKCDAKFTTSFALKLHRIRSASCKTKKTNRAISNNRIYHCQKCHVRFSSPQGLNLHIKRSPGCQVENSEEEVPRKRKKIVESLTEVVTSNEDSEVDIPRGRKEIQEKAKTTKNAPTDKHGSQASATQSNDKCAHYCQKCNVKFSSALGLGLHLKRSPSCIEDNPDVDIPGVVNRKEIVEIVKASKAVPSDKGVKEELVYVCKKCFSFFSSVWGLRTHQRYSLACKPDQPFAIPVPMPKTEAEKLKKGLAKDSPSTPEADESSENGQVDPLTNKKPTKQMVQPSTSENTKNSKTSRDNICPSCSAKFSTSCGLSTHMRNSTSCSNYAVYSGASSFACSTCEQKFASTSDLQDHIKFNSNCFPEDALVTVTGKVKPGNGCFLCPQCPRNFKLGSSLEQHFIEHAPTCNDVFCPKCSQAFSDQYLLHRHFHRQHIGQWFCVICDVNKSKTSLSSFKEFFVHIFDAHEIAVADRRDYFKCMICYRSFISKYSFDHHVNICRKRPEEKFTCASCYKVFTKKIHITTHIKYAHNGVTIDSRFNYKCPNCPRKFTSKEDYLSQHAKAGCRVEEFTCTFCGELYIGADKLEKHLDLCHSSQKDETVLALPVKGESPVNTDTSHDMGPSSSSSSSPSPLLPTETDVSHDFDSYIDIIEVSDVKMEPLDVS